MFTAGLLVSRCFLGSRARERVRRRARRVHWSCPVDPNRSASGLSRGGGAYRLEKGGREVERLCGASARAAGEAGDDGDELGGLDGLGEVHLVAGEDGAGAVLGAG